MSLRLLIIAVFAVVALSVLAYVRGGLPHEVYRTPRAILDLEADARGLYWLEGEAGGRASVRQQFGAAEPPSRTASVRVRTAADAVYVLDGGRGRARRVAAQPGLVALAGDGEALVALQRDGDTGALLLIPRSGAAPVMLAQGLLRPAGLAACGDQVYWTETRSPPVPHAASRLPAAHRAGVRRGRRHIPATQARVVLRSTSLGGQQAGRNLACLAGGAGEFAGEILGCYGGRVCLMQAESQDCGPGWTSIRSVPVDGGRPEMLIRERGPQTGRLAGAALYWTAPSEDAGNPSSARCLRRGELPRPAAQMLTDWLPAAGRLCDAGGRVCYGSAYGVWAASERRALPEPLTSRPVTRNLVAGFGASVYAVQAVNGSETIVRRPLRLAARLRAGLRIR